MTAKNVEKAYHNEVYSSIALDRPGYAKTQDTYARLLAQTVEPLAVQGQVETIIETFGGVGGHTRLLREAFPDAVIFSFERDAECYEQLRVVGEETEVTTFHESFHPSLLEELEISVDANTLMHVDGAHTLAQREWYSQFLLPEAGYWTVCDQSRLRLPLHRKTYNLRPGHEWTDYLELLERSYARPLLGSATNTRTQSYLMFGREA